MKILRPDDQIYWSLPTTPLRQLKSNVKADVVIIGGGMAGLSAAQHFKNKGCSVLVVEKYYCGAGASGKSSGFITPDSEFSLGSFVQRYGSEVADQLWRFVLAGVDTIKTNIETNGLACDYQKQDSLVIATSKKGFASDIEEEAEARSRLGYEGILYSEQTLSSVIGSSGYFGGVKYGGTFGINGFQYLQQLKEVLIQQGVEIYEETPVLECAKNRVTTPLANIDAKYIIICADRWIPDLNRLVYDIYHVQTFLMMSAPLSDKQVQKIFPQERLMVWDTDMLYQYYRVAEDNRLLLGGSTLWQTYASQPSHNNKHMYKKLSTYFEQKFGFAPQWDFMWPGLIGVSKDIMPLAGRDKDDESIYYVGAAAGLPWACALGRYAADVLIDNRSDLDAYFSPYRSFAYGPPLQNILGTRLTFALSHVTSLKSF